jgi:hypothetical protein
MASATQTLDLEAHRHPVVVPELEYVHNLQSEITLEMRPGM